LVILLHSGIVNSCGACQRPPRRRPVPVATAPAGSTRAAACPRVSGTWTAWRTAQRKCPTVPAVGQRSSHTGCGRGRAARTPTMPWQRPCLGSGRALAAAVACGGSGSGSVSGRTVAMSAAAAAGATRCPCWWPPSHRQADTCRPDRGRSESSGRSIRCRRAAPTGGRTMRRGRGYGLAWHNRHRVGRPLLAVSWERRRSAGHSDTRASPCPVSVAGRTSVQSPPCKPSQSALARATLLSC
jgi:hypothetical protein